MGIKMTMRKKMILFFIGLTTLPIMIIYLVASSLFIKSTQNDLLNLYAANIREVGKSADIYFNNALDVSIYPLMDTNLRSFLSTPSGSDDFQQIKKEANDFLMSMPYGYSTGIYGIRLTNMDYHTISTGNAQNISTEDRARADQLNSRPYWDYSDSNPTNGNIYMTRLLKNTSNLSEHIGYVKLSLSCSKLREYLKPDQSDSRVIYSIITQDNLHPLDTDLNETEQADTLTYEKLLKLAETPVNSTIADGSVISAYALERTELIVYSITEPDVLDSTKNSFFINFSVILIMVLIFSICLAVAFSRIITKPLWVLGNHMTSISNEDFTVRYPVNGSDEIALLTDRFNQMAEKLEFLYNEVYMGELRLKQSQLTMLQTQINPHFLYNTLDTIYWMAKMGEGDQVAQMVSNMSKMMRLTLAPQTNDKILLAQELEHLECYINIQAVRYGEKISFHLICPEKLQQEYVLSFLLQPLVENALVHGMSNRLSGVIRIVIYEENNRIIYEVANNGTPIDVDSLHHLLHGNTRELKGFAIRNLNDRLRLKYGEAYCLKYYLEEDFSVFKIIQPKE